MDYLVFAPDYTEKSAGVRCLYLLADRLNKKGFRTYVTGGSVTNPDLEAPIIPMFVAKGLAQSTPVRVIYPETVTGNPLGAKAVIRWVLNRPGLLAGDRVYDARETVFNYSHVYSRYIENPVAGMLYLPTIDRTIFYPGQAPLESRSLICYYVGKSKFQEGYVDRAQAFEIGVQSPAKAELGNLLRSSRVLYCFDNSSILAFEAALCGCPTVIIPDGTQTREDYEKLELGLNGLAWGLKELPLAESTLKDLPEAYARAEREFEKQLDHFIDVTALKDWPGVEPILAAKRRANANCAQCLELEKEIDALYKKVQVYESSRYLMIRSRIRERFPRLDWLLAKTGDALFAVIRSLKRTFLDGAEARKKEDLYRRRKAEFLGRNSHES